MPDKDFAYIESLITDQGNGSSWCSHCDYDLTDFIHKLVMPKECPGCKKKLVFGGTFIPTGGSDF